MNVIRLESGNDYIAYRPGSGNTIEIFDIAVSSERRKGVGRRLVKEMLSKLPKDCLVWAMTRPENTIACTFYSSLGFKVLGLLRGFYSDGDSVVYGLHTKDLGDTIPGR